MFRGKTFRSARALHLAALTAVLGIASPLFADIDRWDNGQPIPDGVGITPGPDMDVTGLSLEYANLSFTDLSDATFDMADLGNATFASSNLIDASFNNTNITGANFSNTSALGFRFGQLYESSSYAQSDLGAISLAGSNLTNSYFLSQNFTNANFSNTDLNNAYFGNAIILGANFSHVANFSYGQLFFTASFSQGNLAGISLAGDDMNGGNFANLNLTGVSFSHSNLTNAFFTNSTILGANFSHAAGFTFNQLSPTASFQQQNLTGISVAGDDMSSGDFASQNLTNANFSHANLTNAYFGSAVVLGANFSHATGFNFVSLISTASYQQQNLAGISVVGDDMSNANLGGQNLTNVNFSCANLTNDYFVGATITGANFSNTTGFLYNDLVFTTNYQSGNLTGISLAGLNMSINWYFANQDLTNANFSHSNLTSVYFGGAIVQGANFSHAVGFDFSTLSATASYQQQNLAGMSLAGDDMSGANFQGQNLTNVDFSSSNLTNAYFGGATIDGANFSNATGLTSSQLYFTNNYQQQNLSGIVLAGDNMSNGYFGNQNLTNANFSGANVTNTSFGNAIILGANFSHAIGFNFDSLSATASYQQGALAGISVAGDDMNNADLTFQDLTNANFSCANLTGASFGNAIVLGANFSHAVGFTFSQLSDTASYQQGTLAGISVAGDDMSNGDFSDQDLTNANFSHSNLTNTDFSDATVLGANFSNAVGFTFSQLASTASYQLAQLAGISLANDNMSGADFSNRVLGNSNLSNANLSGADFFGTNLENANLTGANLQSAEFNEADLFNAIFDCADLRNADNFSPDSTASTNGTIFPDGTIRTLNLTANQTLLVRQTSPSVQITASNPTIGAGASLLIQGNINGSDLINNGSIIVSGNNISALGDITGTGSLSVTGGRLTAASLQLASLSISDAGSMQIFSNAPTSKLGSLTFGGSTNGWIGDLDITNNKLIIEADPLTKPTTFANLQNQVAYGKNHFGGIASSTLTSKTAIAVVDNAALAIPFTTFGGLPVDINSILIAPELIGDANIDGTVGLSDLAIVLNNFGQQTLNWSSGNFDGSASIGLTDLADVLNNFGQSNPNANIATPEPASLTLFAATTLPILLLLRRRKMPQRHVLFS